MWRGLSKLADKSASLPLNQEPRLPTGASQGIKDCMTGAPTALSIPGSCMDLNSQPILMLSW